MKRTIPTREERDAARKAKKLATCKHWNGALGPRPCAVGVDLVKRCGPRVQTGWLNAIPCLDGADPAFVCEAKVTPTVEEIEAQEQRFTEAAARTLSVMAAIPAEGESGKVTCPGCGGFVHWRRSSYNGHLSATCVVGCVAFIQ